MRSRTRAIIGSLAFLVLAPGTVAGLVPYWITGWHLQGRPPGGAIAQLLGALLVGGGLVVLLDSFARFALQGWGTPAPVLPTRTLVVTGFYRFVRNPMYVAVLSLVLGQSLLLGSLELLIYAAVLAIGFDTFVRVYEEPRERSRHREEYARYSAAVRRWRPRLRPWKA